MKNTSRRTREISNCSTSRRGVALMLVMVAVLITGGMAVAYFGSRDNSIAISQNIQTASVARASAETGLDLAIAILETDVDWRTTHIEGVILDEYQIGESKVSISVIDTETASPPTASTDSVEITVQSMVDDVTQTTQATATIIPDEGEFDVDFSEFAMIAQSNIEIRDYASIHNWAVSPLAQQTQEVLIGTLSTSPMSISIQSNMPTHSLVAHTPERASSMVVSKQIDRETFSDTPSMATPHHAGGDQSPLDLQSELVRSNESWRNAWSNQFTTRRPQQNRRSSEKLTISEGAYEIDNLTLSSGQSLHIEGNVSINVTDRMSLDHASIILDDDATLELFVRGNVDVQSSYIGNQNQTVSSWMDPTRFQLDGSEESTWTINGSSTLKGEMYAPDASISVSGNTTICGRIAGDDITMRGASRLLYDQTLDQGGYADQESQLYEDDGELVTGLKTLSELDPVLIDSIQTAASSEYNGRHDTSTDGWMNMDWRYEPTERPHEVIYVLRVYGVDARAWETRAIAHRLHRSTNPQHTYYESNAFTGVLD